MLRLRVSPEHLTRLLSPSVRPSAENSHTEKFGRICRQNINDLSGKFDEDYSLLISKTGYRAKIYKKLSGN
jgi:hypothetical protein